LGTSIDNFSVRTKNACEYYRSTYNDLQLQILAATFSKKPYPSLAMKNPIIKSFTLLSAVIMLSSCAAITDKLATKENIAKLPEPLRSQVQTMVDQEHALAAKYASGTRTMLAAYADIADGVGLKTQAATLRAESQSLNSGSSLSDSRKALSRSKPLMEAVRNKLASSKGVETHSKEKFVEGVHKHTEAYVIEVGVATDAGMKAARAASSLKGASPMQIIMITPQFDPLYYMAKDVPNFLAQERKFNDICKEYAKERKISIPTAPLPTPKLSMGAF